MVTCADPEGRGIEGSHPLLENHKFYGFLELALGPPPLEKFDTPGKAWALLENVGYPSPPPKPCEIIAFFEINQ